MRLFKDEKLTNVLGVFIDTYTKKEVLEKIEEYLSGDRQRYIVTPNPEIILEARKSEEYFYILNQADLALADGMGLKLAGFMMGKNIPRITGADIVGDVLALAEEKQIGTVVFNWSKGLSRSSEIKDAILQKYPKINITVIDVEREWHMPYYQQANLDKPKLALVTLGAPWQEKFIFHQLASMPYIKCAIGIGGALDFMTGKLKRAPGFLRKLGFEWLWRLFNQPWRIKRIYNAVLVFSWEFFKWRFVYPFFYRSNVACLVYKQTTNGADILVVERANEAGHWQLPQGGTDGENITEAGLREIKEEIGTNKIKPVKSFRRLWRYKFGDKKSKFGPKARNIWGYKGQVQGLLIARFIGKDSDIKINKWEHKDWKWVNSEKLLDVIHPTRRTQLMIYLKKFSEILNNNN